MDALVVLVIVVVLAIVVAVVSAPLRAPAAADDRDAARRADLQAAKDAKYREIRDAEMDYRTGKLSEADYRALDRQLRGEAIAILRELDALDAASR
jgi:flagellar biosynthesis/type III secretory pathway M-ring protein FliF/YscJ